LKIFVYLLFMLFVSSCGSMSRHSKSSPDKLNSITIKTSLKDEYKHVKDTLKELDLNIKEEDYKNSEYIVAETVTPVWMYLLSWYGNYGSLIGVYLKEDPDGVVVWVETESKFKSLGSIFEKDWKVDILNRVVSKDIDYRSEHYSKDKLNNIAIKSTVTTEKREKDLSTYMSNRCMKKYDWVQSEMREQGGGWIWFLGKGSSKSLKTAYYEAEVMSLHRLSLECSAPHMNTRMIERCDDTLVDGTFVAYVRANLKEKECSQLKTASSKDKPKLINPFLQKIADTYK